MGLFGIEFRFPRNEDGLRNLMSVVEHPERARNPYLDEGEITILIDGRAVLPPWRYEPEQRYTALDWVGDVLRNMWTATERLGSGDASAMCTFLDSPMAVEFERDGTEVEVVVVAEVGVELTRTPIARTRVHLEDLTASLLDAMRRYDARLRELDPKLAGLYGFGQHGV